jgi:hypothetical protein
VTPDHEKTNTSSIITSSFVSTSKVNKKEAIQKKKQSTCETSTSEPAAVKLQFNKTELDQALKTQSVQQIMSMFLK